MGIKKAVGITLIFAMLAVAGCGLTGTDAGTGDNGTTPPVEPKTGQKGEDKGGTSSPGKTELKYLKEFSLVDKGLKLHSLAYSQEGNIFVSPDGKLAALSALSYSRNDQAEPESQLIVANLTNGSVKVLDAGRMINVIQWSPNGDKILYRKYETLMVADVNGGRRVELSNRSYYGSISPDGSKVAYVESGKGISVAGIDGSGRKQLTDKRGDWYPVWYPDGKNIFYFDDRGITLTDGAGQLQGLGRVNVETGKTWQLIPGETGKYRRAVWVAKDTLLINKGWDDGNFEIIANLATGTVTELGENYMHAQYSTALDKNSGLVFKAEKDKVSAVDGNGRTVWSVPYKKPVNDSKMSNFGYTVSPDGKMLAYLFGEQGFDPESEVKGRQIWVSESGGANPHVLTKEYSDYHQPAWTPDGKHLVAVETDDGKGEKFIIRILDIGGDVK